MAFLSQSRENKTKKNKMWGEGDGRATRSVCTSGRPVWFPRGPLGRLGQVAVCWLRLRVDKSLGVWGKKRKLTIG